MWIFDIVSILQSGGEDELDDLEMVQVSKCINLLQCFFDG